MVGVDLNAIRHALALARKKGCDEVELRFNGIGFQARLATPATAASFAQAESTAPETEDGSGTTEVASPVVGYHRVKGKPMEVGRKVKKGEILAVVAGLGLETDVESPVDGEIVEVLVQPDQAVEYGMALARVEVTR